MDNFGEELLSKILLKNTPLAPLITSIVGLIPNCGSSVVLTELYLNSAITYEALIAGLLTGSGIGLLVLFRVNKPLKDNLKILGIIYLLGSITGIIMSII